MMSLEFCTSFFISGHYFICFLEQSRIEEDLICLYPFHGLLTNFSLSLEMVTRKAVISDSGPMDLARMNRWMSHTNTPRGPPETILILNAATQDANLLSNFAVM